GLHADILAHLAGVPDADPARLAYHAEAAADAAAVLRYAPAAAERAAGLGAHREAAAHYARALRHTTGTPLPQQAELWERRAVECSHTGQISEARKAAARAVELWRATGDVQREGAVMARRAGMLWQSGRNA